MLDKKHNNPPDPIDEALAPFGDDITEAENWLDGSPVETEAQMRSVDALLASIKAAKKAVTAAEDSEAKPLYDQWKSAKARFKPTLDDLDRIVKGLTAAVGTFKKKLADEKGKAEREARAKADEARRAAEVAVTLADASDIEAQREAAAKMATAAALAKDVGKAVGEKVKGLRTVHRYEVTDYRALLHWIAANDKDAMTDFIEEYARTHHKTTTMDGVKAWTEKEAF
jgi:ribosomal protein L17